jgi:type I restriction enzyme S subunit
MADEWETVELGEVAAVRSGYAFKSSDWKESGIPVVKIANVKGGRLDMAGSSFVAEATAAKSGDFQLSTGDILIAMTGYIGEVARVRRSDLPCVLNQRVGKFSVRDKNRLDPDFLYTFLAWTETRQFIEALGYGSAQPNVSPSLIHKVELPLPPLAEQKAIAAVLGALDDKIELNRRMNVKLEEMARALFQSWFVDFDPVRAKLDGRELVGLDQATADLFPERFEETNLGHIPNGWEVKTLGEVIELAYGKPLKAEDRKHGPVCVYGANGPIGWHDEKLVSGPGIIVGRKGNPGVVTWAHGDFYPIDTTFYVKPIGACRSLFFFYYALSLHNLANLGADSAVPGLNRNHAYLSRQVIPSRAVLTAFDSQIAPIFAAIHANEKQTRSLALARGMLLPKLLSGELTVSRKPGPE